MKLYTQLQKQLPTSIGLQQTGSTTVATSPNSQQKSSKAKRKDDNTTSQPQKRQRTNESEFVSRMSSKSSQVPLASLQTRIAESEAKIEVEIEDLEFQLKQRKKLLGIHKHSRSNIQKLQRQYQESSMTFESLIGIQNP